MRSHTATRWPELVTRMQRKTNAMSRAAFYTTLID